MIQEKALKGDVASQLEMATQYEDDLVKKTKWIQMAANRGNRLAEFMLGLAFLTGNGVVQNDTEAAGWFRKAAEQGHPEAQSALGSLYNDGRGVLQNFSEAVKWMRKAAMQGNNLGQHALGFCYAKGKGVPQNFSEAFVWLSIAATGENNQEAAMLRDQVAEKLTFQTLEKAQARAQRLHLQIEANKPTLDESLGLSKPRSMKGRGEMH